MSKPKYDSTVARIAGNVASGLMMSIEKSASEWQDDDNVRRLAELSVGLARAIVEETKRTEPKEDPQP